MSEQDLDLAQWRDVDPERVIEALLVGIAFVTQIPRSAIDLGRRLDDLGVDSLLMSELILEIETEIEREIPLEVLERVAMVETVGALIDMIRSSLTSFATGDATDG